MDWNQAYLDGNTPWDKGAPSPVVADLISEIPQLANVVIPGCGTGNDVLAILEVKPKTITCIDLAPKAIAILGQRFDSFPNVKPVLGDFMSFAAAHPSASDVIVEHTCFCAIPVALRSEYASACATLLPPGGKVIGAFYWIPRDTDDISIGPPYQTSEAELNTLFCPWFDIEITVATVGFPERVGREFRVVMTRRPDVNDEASGRSV
ncbi:MAG: methyltransferase domain-containing protein [Armatimonadota bacterium]